MKNSDPRTEITGTVIVCDTPCGVSSIILVGDGTNAGTIKLYDDPAIAAGSVIKALAVKSQSSAVYCPYKSDSFSKGCVAVVEGTGAFGYVSITPI